MGRQVNFYLHTQDLASFFQLLKERDVVFIPTQYDEQQLSIIENPSVENPEDMYLVRKEDLDKLTFRELGGINKAWGIDMSIAPVIELDRSGYVPEYGIIKRGRLYFRPDYYEGSELMTKDETFICWADSLIGMIRRKLIKRKEIRGFKSTFYLGEYANEWVERNSAEVRSGGYILEITKLTDHHE